MPPDASPATAVSRIPAPVRGALWMVLSCLFFSLMNVLVRHVAGELHPFEIAFFRNAFGLLFILPWFWRSSLASFATTRIRLYGFRAITSTGAMLCWFTVLTMMPIAEVTALSFTVPLFATVGAALFLGEVVRIRRWAATLVGFTGAMIILRPGIETIDFPVILVLAASIFIAISILCVKSASKTDSAHVIVFYAAMLMTPLSLVPALLFWTAPAPKTWAWLAALGLMATLAHICLNRAFAIADVTAVLPFDFFRLIFVATLGLVLFGERPDIWLWMGSAVIFCATLYIAHREAVTAREPVRQTVAQPVIDGAGPAGPAGPAQNEDDTEKEEAA